MTFVAPKARIVENSITAGNGPYLLGGAVDGSYNSFASFMVDGDVTRASIVEPGVAFWTGLVTYAAGANTITPTTVEEAKGSFGAGTKEIIAGQLAASIIPEDITGAIVTGGTSTAYTLASHRKYDSLARLHDNVLAFTPHVTNGANGTSLNVDELGPKPVLLSPGVGLIEGVLIQGTPYVLSYNNTDGAFYLRNAFSGNPYNVPLGGGLDYWLATAPNSAFAFPFGQAISRTTYAALFALMGTTYGAGNGSTTFNLPDKRGRVSACNDSLGGTAAGRLTTYTMQSGSVLGASGGLEKETLATANLPPYTPVVESIDLTAHISNNQSTVPEGAPPQGNFTFYGPFANQGAVPTTASIDGSITMEAQGGTSTPVSTVQPTIICNYIMRVL